MKTLLLLFALSTATFSFSQVPTASFSAPDTACQGSIITFTNTSSGGTAPLSYIWNFGNQEVLDNVQNPNYAYPVQGNFIVTLVTTDANGFSASTSQLIKILAPPFAVISTTAANEVGCSPHLVTFLNLTVQPTPYNPMNHFDWSFSDGSPGITTFPATPQTSIQHTFIGEGAPSTIIGLGSYIATLTAYNNFGCSSFSTKEIYLIPLPTATAGGSQTICSNSSATVSGASSLNGTIFWTHNGVGNITNGQGTLSPTYTSVIEDAGNTVTLTMTVSSTYTLACSPPAIATFTIFVNPSSINTTTASACNSYTWNGITYTTSGVYTGPTANCVTESLNLTITPSSTNTTTASACDNYTWNGQTYTQSGVYTGTTANCVTESLNLTITPSSTNTTTAAACDSYAWNGQTYTSSGVYTGTTANCVTESLNLTITPSAINTISASVCSGFPYIWNNQSYSTSGSYTQTFIASNGCDSVVTLNLTLNPTNFNPVFSSTQQLFTSPPFAVQFSNTTANIGNYNFTWYWGDGTSSASNNSTVFHEYLNNGLYTITLVATNTITGCSDETTYNDYIYATGGVGCLHSASINQSGTINACSGQPVLLTCNSNPNFTYQWRNNGVYISGNNNDSLYVSQTGSYSVIISFNGCPVASSNVVVNLQSIEQPTINSSGSIQPCIGGSVTLTASSGFTSYLWSNGATTSSITVNSSGNYTVQVTSSNGCSSTSAAFVVNASLLPTQNICVVGVDSLTNNIRLVWEKPLTTAIDSFYIYKESNVADLYTQIGSRAYDSLSIWIDPISNPAVQSYRYKITAFDTCGVETPLSDFHKTIHLTINQGVGGAWNLIWSHYEGINFGSYKIYRGTSLSNMALLTTIQSNLNSYTDLNPPTGLVYYQIEIINPNNCSPTKSINYSSSKSNITSNGQNELLVITSDYISIFPNPTTSIITVKSSLELIGKECIIYDQLGKEVMSGLITSEETEIDLSNISEGVYLFKVGEEMQETFRIIKQ